MQRGLNQIVDESFMVNNRLITATHCTPSDLSTIRLDRDFKVGPGDYELREDLQNYFKGQFNSEAKNELILTVNKIAEGSPTLVPYIQKSAQKLRIDERVCSSEISEYKEYWGSPVNPKKCTIRSFVKPNHEYLDNQIIYFHFKDHLNWGTSDVIVRSSRGEILMVFWNCKLSEVEGKLASKLKHLQKSSIFCVFVNESKSRTVNLSYFENLTKNSTGFVCLNTNIKVNPEYVCLKNQHSLLILKINPNIYIFKYKGQAIAGSLQAISLGLNGGLDRLLEQFSYLLKKQQEYFRIIPITESSKFEHRTIELKYMIVNLLIMEQPKNTFPNIQKALTNVLQYCLNRAAMNQEKKLDSLGQQVAHFPIILKHCKECRACLKSYREEVFKNKKKLQNTAENGQETNKKLKIRKTKYQCESCSFQEGKPVPLCVLCFARYHRNISHYTDFPIDLSNNFSLKVKRKKQRKIEKNQEEFVKIEENPPLISSMGVYQFEIAKRLRDLSVELVARYQQERSSNFATPVPILMVAQQHFSSESSTSPQAKEVKQQAE